MITIERTKHDLIDELFKLIESVTSHEQQLDADAIDSIKIDLKKSYIVYSLSDLVYTLNLAHKVFLTNILKILKDDKLFLRPRTCLNLVKERKGKYSINNYIKQANYVIRIAQLYNYYITEVIPKNSIKLKIVSKYRPSLCDEVVRDCVIGLRASDECLLSDRRAIEMKTTQIWQAALWVALHSPASFSIRACKAVLSSNKALHTAFTLRTYDSKYIMDDLTKYDALRLLKDKPVRWLCYLLGDGSVSGRKIEFSINTRYFKEILNQLSDLGYSPKYRKSKRIITISGRDMRKFARWLLEEAYLTGISKVLDKLNINKWKNIKEYATIQPKTANLVETPCGKLRKRKDRPVAYLAGNFGLITKMSKCLEDMGVKTRVYKNKGTYMLELSLRQLNSVLGSLEDEPH